MHFQRIFIIGAFLMLKIAISAQTYSIQGKVTGNNNAPLADAAVIINDLNLSTTTDSLGTFILTGITTGKHELNISYIGYLPFIKVVYRDLQDSIIHVTLQKEEQIIQEVTVSQSSERKSLNSSSINIDIIKEEFLKENNAGTLMQTLEKIPGIQSMDIGTGISKPMIRGLGYYRIIVAKKGIIHQGQNWSSHHGLAIDQQSVKHVEIIKGPAALRFGTNAIGGAINILPEHLPLQTGVQGEASITGQSNSGRFGGSIHGGARRKDIFVNFSATYNKYADFKIPLTNEFVRPAPSMIKEASHSVELGEYVFNTAGQEQATSLSLGVIKRWGTSSIDFSWYKSKAGFFDWERSQYDSVKIRHEQNRYDYLLPFLSVNHLEINHFTTVYIQGYKVEASLGYQGNISEEHSYLTDITGNRFDELRYYRDTRDKLDLLLDLRTIHSQVHVTKKMKRKHKIMAGINAEYQEHTIDGFNHIIPSYSRFVFGSYITDSYSITSKTKLSAGMRFENTKITFPEIINPDYIKDYNDSIFNIAYGKSFPESAFSVGVTYQPTHKTTYKFNIARSGRAPSIYELAAYGLHRHGARFEKGDINLEAEKVIQCDTGIEKQGRLFSFSVQPYINYFTNYIYLYPTAEVHGTMGQVYQSSQNKALFTGGECSANYTINDNVRLWANSEFVYAVNLDKHSAIPQTPPLHVISGADYMIPDFKHFTKNKFRAECEYISSQNYTVPNELSTPGYTLYNFFVSSELKFGSNSLILQFKLSNIFNTKYFNHLSLYRRLRIPEPGRNFQIFVSIPFQSNNYKSK